MISETEDKKPRREERKNKNWEKILQAGSSMLQILGMLVICFAFFCTMLVIVDHTVNKIIGEEVPTKAMGIKKYDETLVLEIVGKKYLFDIEK